MSQKKIMSEFLMGIDLQKELFRSMVLKVSVHQNHVEDLWKQVSLILGETGCRVEMIPMERPP